MCLRCQGHKPPPPEKRDGAPVEGGCSKQSSNSLDWRGGVLGGLLDGYLCRHLQQEGGKVDSTISSYCRHRSIIVLLFQAISGWLLRRLLPRDYRWHDRGKAHELARQILKEGEPVCEHHVPHVSVEDQHMNSKPKRRFFECDGFVLSVPRRRRSSLDRCRSWRERSREWTALGTT